MEIHTRSVIKMGDNNQNFNEELPTALEFTSKESEKGPDSTSWHHLAAGYHIGGRMIKATETMKKAILKTCIQYLKEQGDVGTAEKLLKMIKERGGYSESAYDELASCKRNSNLATIALYQVEDDNQNFGEELPIALEFTV
ncbi:conserved hypothetical protein [Ricinus communis]|uniref:Pentatricopeptide repeat-containing protein n=1 Tax=Ricinus communis TaxID=3988 RepID=B9RW09_RICCO|nr:conserved hypothetical protein [Ricinus communis]